MRRLLLISSLLAVIVTAQAQTTRSVRLYFEQGRWELKPDFRSNGIALERFAAEVVRDTATITVIGSVSPEGSRSRNEELADRRADELIRAVRLMTGLPESRFVKINSVREGLVPAIGDRSVYPEFRTATAVQIVVNEVATEVITDTVYRTRTRYIVKPYPVHDTVKVALWFGRRPLSDHRPKLALKNNLLYDAILTPNLGVELFVGNRFSFNIEGLWTWISTKNAENLYYVWSVSPEVRYWFDGSGTFRGHFIGLNGFAGQYDIKLSRQGRQGDYIGGGITYGYSLPLNDALHLEFTLGAGYVHSPYKKYDYTPECYPLEERGALDYFGLTKAGVSLSWRFGTKRGGAK